MRLKTHILLCLSATLALSSCAGLSTQLPEISMPSLNAEKKAQEKLLFAEWDAMAERLLRVGRPILLANVELCPKVTRDIGVMTHNQELYGARLKAGSERELGAVVDSSIFHIAIDSPAQRAGLRRGDILRNEKGFALSAQRIQKALLETETLSIERNGELRSFSSETESVCDYELQLKQSAAVNAYADGRRIIVTTGMMDFIESDEELAIIVGHELAHNTMGHIRKIVSNLILSGLATRYTRPFESEADYVGMYFAKRAGYDIEDVEKFWRRLAVRHPKNVNRAKTHPIFPDRYLRLEATRKEIERKVESNQPLFPNFKTKKKFKS